MTDEQASELLRSGRKLTKAEVRAVVAVRTKAACADIANVTDAIIEEATNGRGAPDH
ncbi:MAG: hypothetical protein WA741_15530 [Candidatus Sulfotelmatobacter sp.]